METLIIHGGIPKTGSSTLQVFLAKNYARLKANSYEYFKLGEFAQGENGRISSGNGALIARSLLASTDLERIDDGNGHLEALHDAIRESDCTTGLISSEFFAAADPDKLSRWAHKITSSGIKLKYIYLIRSQHQWLASGYVQAVKRAGYQGYPEEFVRSYGRNLLYLNYATSHQILCRIFGAANVICRTYEEVAKSDLGLCHMFLNLIGLADAGLVELVEPVNTSLTLAEIAVMRAMNKFRPRMNFSDTIIANSFIIGRGASQDHISIFSPELNTEISDQFAEENRLMAERCFNRTVLFPSAAQHSGSLMNLDEVSLPELLNILGGIIVAYDHRIGKLEEKMQNGRSLQWVRHFPLHVREICNRFFNFVK